MALLSDVIGVLNNYRQAVTLMNNSVSELETKKIAIEYSNVHAGVNWGNSLPYLENINDSLLDISLYVGTDNIAGVVDKFNTAVERFIIYLSSHWWQFGCSDRPQIADIPEIPLLV